MPLQPYSAYRMTKWVTIVAVSIAALLSMLWGYRRWVSSAAGKPQYKIAKVKQGTVRFTVSATGTIQPWSTVDIKSKAGGKIDQLLVDVGTSVKKGQIVARIDPTDSLLPYNQAKANTQAAIARKEQNQATYDLTRLQTPIAVEQAQANLSSAVAAEKSAAAKLRTALDQSDSQPALTRSAIAQAKANYDAVLEERHLLDSTQTQERATDQSQLDQATANLRNNKATLTRTRDLYLQGFIAPQSVDQAQMAYDVSRAQVTSAQTTLSSLDHAQAAARRGSDAKVAQALAQYRNAQASAVDVSTRADAVKQARADLEQAKAQVAQMQSQLALARANTLNNRIRSYDIDTAQAEIETARASYSNAKVTLDQTVVTAPSDGLILQKYVDQGTIITSGLSLNSTGSSLVQLGDVSRLYVDVQVDETDIAHVAKGERVNISMEAFPGVPFRGKVILVNPVAQVDQNVTTVHVRVEINNQQRSFKLLKPNMNATCEFIQAEARDVISVPSEAVHQDQSGSYVQIATGGKAAPNDPTLGLPADPNLLEGVTVTRRSVKTGLVGNDSTQILEGLRSGEQVILQTISAASRRTSTPSSTSSPFGMRPPGMGGGGARR
ncbi:MAG TPA: efflux RND transporter periplasmic adaptor subunit [Fimbriimonas sp.]|nr:efflux RND transporter periplasmic adaptor subunit [Fimbriimonas sp.]